MKHPARAGAAIASAILVVVVAALVLLGPYNLAGSRLPQGLYGAVAAHWKDGEPRDCSLCPGNLFVVVCDADQRIHLRGMRELAALRKTGASDGKSGSNARAEIHPCLGRRAFRLERTEGGYGAPYDEDDPRFRFDLSYKMIGGSGGAQLVEVRYRDSRTDIDDALFRYETADGEVRPLESWVITRGHRMLGLLGVFVTLGVVVLAWALYFGGAALRRFLASRRARDSAS